MISKFFWFDNTELKTGDSKSKYETIWKFSCSFKKISIPEQQGWFIKIYSLFPKSNLASFEKTFEQQDSNLFESEKSDWSKPQKR